MEKLFEDLFLVPKMFKQYENMAGCNTAEMLEFDLNLFFFFEFKCFSFHNKPIWKTNLKNK